MGIRTTVVGSWWRNPEHEAALASYHNDELSADDGEEVLGAASAMAIQQQIDLGLDEWTGGEYFTHDFILHMHKRLTGIEIDKPEADEVFDYDDMTHSIVTGEITAPDGLGYIAAFEREKDLPGGVRKASVVAPYEVVVSGRDQLDKIMPQMAGITAMVNHELRAIADGGCPTVQLDAPIFGAEVNMGTMTAKEAADMIAPCFEGVNATKALHICNGNLAGRPVSNSLRVAPWVEILQHLDGVIDVATFEVKYFSQFWERESFKDMPQSMSLAAGIIDEGNYRVEPVQKIRERIAAWAEVVGEDRLWVSPSCGFGRHPARNIPVLRAKVENMVEAAQSL
jgi:5-methyltetrahydropteroyltriglutamate--homocysteine methyltransferase